MIKFRLQFVPEGEHSGILSFIIEKQDNSITRKAGRDIMKFKTDMDLRFRVKSSSVPEINLEQGIVYIKGADTARNSCGVYVPNRREYSKAVLQVLEALLSASKSGFKTIYDD